MNDKCKKPETEEKKADLAQELEDEALNDVTGAGSPWEDADRVPEQEIPDPIRSDWSSGI